MTLINFKKIIATSLIALSLNAALAIDLHNKEIAGLLHTDVDNIKFQNSKSKKSSGNHIFEVNGKKYVLKIFDKKAKMQVRENEVKNAKLFSDLGIGAKLVAVSKDNSFYVREYISGKFAKPSDFQNETIVINLAKALQKLHKSVEKADKTKTQEYIFDKHYKSIKRKQIALPSDFEKAYENYKSLYKSLPGTIGFCHNDLRPFNILIDDKNNVFFTTASKCGNANIYEDLGCVTLLCGIQGEMLTKFLNNYFGRTPSDAEVKGVKQAQKLTSLLTAITFFDFSEDKKDKKISIEERQKLLDELLKSKDLKSAEEFIKEGKTVKMKSKNKSLIKQYALAFYKMFQS